MSIASVEVPRETGIISAPNIIVAPDLGLAPPDFVHLHVHTDYSLLDGCSRIDKLVARAHELGQRSIAITDHGNLYGAFDFWMEAKNASKSLKDKGLPGIQSILGCEIYVVFDHKNTDHPAIERNKAEQREAGKGGRYHMGVLAKDFKGYQNLVKIVSDAHVSGKWNGKERTDLEHLAAHAEGLIGFSGCMQGVIPQALLRDDWGRARSALNTFLDIFGKENYFIEIMDHGLPEQIDLNPKLLKLASENGLKVVCSNDVHYVYEGDVAAHDALLCIQTGAKLGDEKRMRYPAKQFYLKSGDEMFRIFGERPEVLRNTCLVAEMCAMDFKTGGNNYPVYHLTSEQDAQCAEIRNVEIGRARDAGWSETVAETEKAEFEAEAKKRDEFIQAAKSAATDKSAPVSAQPPPLPPNPSPLKIDRILDSYVSLKNGLLAAQGKLADFDIPEEKRKSMRENGTYLLDLCKKGLRFRYGVDYDSPAAWADDAPRPQGQASPAELCKRTDYELSVIAGTGFIDYFLIVWDFIDWARKHGIPVGPGRGSGAGSLVAYCLKITDIDPIRFNLLFERFLNPERVSAPDFDIDFCMNRRELVVDYVKGKYGRDRVSNIVTYGTFGAKMCVRDLARVLDLPFSESNRLAKLVPDDPKFSLNPGKDCKNGYKSAPELVEEMGHNPVARKIVEEGCIIEGMVRNLGRHACGMIIADRPLTDIVPVTLLEDALTTQYSKDPVEKLGLLKMDFLGLRTLTIIDDAVQHVRRRAGLEKFDIEDVSQVPLDDPATFRLLNAGKTVAVFQLESEGMRNLCCQFHIENLDEIIALIALYRPGPMQFIPDYIAGKKDSDSVKYIHQLLKDVSAGTYGILVYQEQVMEAARVVAGYTLGGADELRRAMGKKKKEEMDRHRGIFIEGAAKTHGIPKAVAEEIFNVLEKFAAYGFNKSHSAAYAILSYRTAYLKANYPVEFMAATLVSESGNAEKVAFFVEECANMDISVLGPHINESGVFFTPLPDLDWKQSGSPGCIRYGVGSVKGVGELAAKAIVAEREKNGPYKGLEDFIQRLAATSAVNTRVFENLVKTGAFDHTGEDRRHLLDSIEGIRKSAGNTQADRATGQASFFDLFAADAATTSSSGVSAIRRDGPKMPSAEKLQVEKELLGFYLSGHPMNVYAGLETAINTLQGPFAMAVSGYAKGKNVRHPVRLAGVATAVQKKMTKGDKEKGTEPKPWAFFTLDSKQDAYTINLFPEAYAAFHQEIHPANARPLLDEGQHLLVDAEISYREDRDEWSLNAHRIAPLAERLPSIVKSVLFVLHPVGEAVDFLEKLRADLDANPGRTAVQIGLLQPDGRILHSTLPAALLARFTPEFYRTFSRHPACASAHPQTIPPVEREHRSWPRRR
ncbi:MAG: DNA polymerase III subunit alpha [Puniceicoccales bacterium]|nr:DNA polymerase III subunit alpha [Puniceicoccales bacterium]